MSWPMVKLGDIFDIARGGSPRPIDDYITDADDGLNWISIKDASNSNKYINSTKLKIKPEGLTKTRMVYPGDFLLTNSMSFGRPYIMNTTGCIHDGWLVLSGNPDKVNSDYFYYLLGSDTLKQRFSGLAAGAVVKNLNTELVKSVEVPLPPLAEQKRIAAILDKADAIRRKRQQAIQLADDFLRAVFLQMFGDPVTNPKGFPIVKLGDLCEDLFLGLTSKVDYIEGSEGFPLVRAKDINTGELSFEDVKYISQEQHRKLTKNHLTRKGDLLVSKSGTLGTCAIVRTDREFSTYESIFTVRPDCYRLDIYYLIHLLQNKGFKEKLLGNKVGGTVAHLNLKMFRDFEIGMPPIKLQKEFADTILKCEKKLDAYRQSNQHADELFTAISQKAFSGQL